MTGDQVQGNKTTGVAYLLWFFLGWFGAHRFYCGKTGSGIGMLALNLGSFVLTFLLVGVLGYLALGVWWVVDAFLIKNWLAEDAATPQFGGAVAGGTPGPTNFDQDQDDDSQSATSQAA